MEELELGGKDGSLLRGVWRAACCVQLAKYLAHYFDFIARTTTDNGTCDNGHLRSLHGRIVAVINCMRLFWGRRVAAATGGGGGGERG